MTAWGVVCVPARACVGLVACDCIWGWPPTSAHGPNEGQMGLIAWSASDEDMVMYFAFFASLFFLSCFEVVTLGGTSCQSTSYTGRAGRQAPIQPLTGASG